MQDWRFSQRGRSRFMSYEMLHGVVLPVVRTCVMYPSPYPATLFETLDSGKEETMKVRNVTVSNYYKLS
jgi:hypothetical protein